MTEINDIRSHHDFKGVTFSEFKKTDVKKELLNSLINSKIEQSCYWSAELVCSGHYMDLWEIILLFYSKHVHLGNPRMAIYLDMRLNDFRNILNNGFIDGELRLRNNIRIRKLFCEVMCILCNCKRKHTFDSIKIRDDDFDMTQMTDRFKAPDIKYAEDIFLKDDPKELLVAINELAFNLSVEGKNLMTACYWIEWIIEFDSRCKSRREKVSCERRTFAKVDDKLQMELIWIIWDIFLQESERRCVMTKKIMNCLLNLFCLKFTSGAHKKRKHILFFAVSCLCENVNFKEEILQESQKPILNVVIQKIDLIYKQIKKNEITPGTDYLFKNVHASNLEKTIAKLETMNTFGEEFIPRV